MIRHPAGFESGLPDLQGSPISSNYVFACDIQLKNVKRLCDGIKATKKPYKKTKRKEADSAWSNARAETWLVPCLKSTTVN